MAEISRILAEVNIPIMALSAFSRDHLLIKQGDLAKALKTFGKYVDSVC
ncbi:MAG: ACT domain-containing protein [Pyrinomonadaceae bacterium]